MTSYAVLLSSSVMPSDPRCPSCPSRPSCPFQSAYLAAHPHAAGALHIFTAASAALHIFTGEAFAPGSRVRARYTATLQAPPIYIPIFISIFNKKGMVHMVQVRKSRGGHWFHPRRIPGAENQKIEKKMLSNRPGASGALVQI